MENGKLYSNELEKKFFLKSHQIQKMLQSLHETIRFKIAKQAGKIEFDKDGIPCWDENSLSNLLISYEKFEGEINELIESLKNN